MTDQQTARRSRVRSAVVAIAALVVVVAVAAIVTFGLPRPTKSAGSATGPTISQGTPSAAAASSQGSATADPPSATTDPPSATTDVPTPTVDPSPVPTSTPAFDTILQGDAVTAVGRLLESSTGTVTLCSKPFATTGAGGGPSLVGCTEHAEVEVTGLDVHSLPGRQEINAWMSSYVRVTGTWSAGVIVADSAATVEPSPGRGRRTVPCPTPPGGWPGEAPSLASHDPVALLQRAIRNSPDKYSGLWVAWIGATDETALIVGTVDDVDTVRDELSATFPYNLCVVAVEFAAVELDHVNQELQTAGRSWQSSVDFRSDRVTVVTAVLDAATVEALTPYADMITVEVTVEHAH